MVKSLILVIFFDIIIITVFASQDDTQFIYNGFKEANLSLDGLANIRSNGLLQLTNTSKQQSGHAFYPKPLHFNDTDLSFSTSFVFAMNPDVPNNGGHGIAFFIASSVNFTKAVPAEYLGLFDTSNNGLSSDHIFAVELDTVQNAGFNDTDGNHVGIDVNSLRSNVSATAGYYSDDNEDVLQPLQFMSGKPMQIWIDYDGKSMVMNVTLAPLKHSKPRKSLLSTRLNLSTVFLDTMYIGFSASTGITANEHYILGWSWSRVGPAQMFDLSKLPSLPNFNPKGKMSKVLIGLLVALFLSLILFAVVGYVLWRKKFEEVEEPWEKEYSMYRLSYKDLYRATKGFRDSEVLGEGGFGKVYKGVISSNNSQVAVKRISHGSSQGMREFVSEIASMRRLRHRNLVELLGYCRRKGELILVYEYMPNGSLDMFLYRNQNMKPILSWGQRFDIIKGVASALLYLHEESEQLVLHRDIKASNVLLDANMNARLSDFGLARLYDHDSNPRSTHVVGTLGYLAPELSITGKPTTATDVFAFGAFLLEVACGRRPVGVHNPNREDFLLVDWVFESWKKGSICSTSDPKLEGGYTSNEMELVLKLGLHCSNHYQEARPSMRQVVQFLRREADVPDIPHDYDLERDDFSDGRWGVSGSVVLSVGTLFSDNSVNHSHSHNGRWGVSGLHFSK